MKTILLALLLLAGCGNKCPDCLTLTLPQLSTAMEKAYSKGFNDGVDAVDSQRLKAL